MKRDLFRLDTALLERRLWLSQLAERRGCSIEEAEVYEREQMEFRRLYALIAVGVLATFIAILWGAS